MKALRKALFFLISLVVGGAVGFLIARHGLEMPKPPGWGPGHKLALLALLPVAWLLAVGLHELGHVLAGRTQGFDFRWLTVGPLKWKSEGGQLRFELNKSLNLAGGLALCVPRGDHDLARRFVAFALGGPLGSLAWAGLALGLYAGLAPAATPLAHLPLAALGASGLISALLFVVTLLPMHAGGFTSDGGRVLTLLRGGPAAELELALLATMTHSLAGTRPRDLPRPALEAALQAVASLPSPPPFAKFVHHYLYLHHLDAGNPATAAEHLAAYRAAVAELPPAMQGAVWLESAWFAAAYEHAEAAAREYEAQAKPSPLTPAELPPRVAAALARLSGDPAAARAQAEAALRELPKVLDPGAARLHADWLRETLAWAEEVRTLEKIPLLS